MVEGPTETKDRENPDELEGTAGAEGGDPKSEGGDAEPELPKSLEERIEELEQELAEAKDQMLRAAAEAQNVRRRVQREKSEAIRYANESLLRDVLPILDNLYLAVDHAGEEDSSSVVEGVRMVLRMFEDLLQRCGLEEVDARPGTPFDPAIHDALAAEPSDEHPPNAVLRRDVRGYRLGERVLRPARVVVTASAGGKAAGNGD